LRRFYGNGTKKSLMRTELQMMMTLSVFNSRTQLEHQQNHLSLKLKRKLK
jgi:hypothetical protein